MHFLNEHMWSHPPVKGEGSAALPSWEIWLSVWFVTRCWTLHITTSPHHCAANQAVNCKNPTDLTRCDPHEYYQVNCCSVSHRTVCYAWFVAVMFNIHPILNIFKWIKSNTFWNINSYSLIEQYVMRKVWWFFPPSNWSFLDINSKWCKKCVVRYYFNKIYSAVCCLMKMINQ